MNIGKIMLKLHSALENDSDPYSTLALSKAIEKLNVGAVTVVETTASLPAAATSTVGEIYLVENDNDLYVNVGAQWNSLNNELIGVPYSWGRNGSGQLGDGTATSSISSPVSVVGGLSNWIQLDGGMYHTIGLRADGTAYTWGLNHRGQLGTGDTSNRSSPGSVIGGITNWAQVSAGYYQCLGVTSTGIAYGWGFSNSGRLGDGGGTQSRLSPVTVVGGLTWSRVSAGQHHGLGLTTTGIAYAWGRNSYGALGDGTVTSRLSPVTVVGGITNWTQLSGGGFSSLGLTSTGIAYAWGLNTGGQLGDGTTTSRLSPVSVIGGITNWSQLSAGGGHSVGVTSTGIAYGWGYNGNGRLGDGTTTGTSSPVSVIGGITNWIQVVGGGNHSLGLTSTGVVYGWGRNVFGQLGDNTATSRLSPVTVVGGISAWIQIEAGDHHSLGLNGILKSV